MFDVKLVSNGTLNGWYVLYLEPFPHGVYGCWKRYPNETLKWSAKSESEMTQEEKSNYRATILAAKEKLTQMKDEVHLKAKEIANRVWHEAKPANSDHPYLLKKKINPNGARLSKNGELIIPICDTQKTIHSLQFINGDGHKMFLKDGAINGYYFSIGKATETIYLAEGFATASSVHQATGCGVVVVFHCGNLLSVAEAIRQKFPASKLIIAADNDAWSSGNPGLTKAREAAEKVGAAVVSPTFKSSDSKPTDFNDLMVLEGIKETKKQLAINQPGISLNKSSDESGILCQRISDIPCKPIKWLWNGNIACGKVSIIAGNPGLGKSQLTASLAAIVTTGGKYPVDNNTCQEGNVILLSAEDDVADTIRPRLEAAAANISKVFFIEGVNQCEHGVNQKRRYFNLKTDLERLSNKLNEIQNVRLIIIDPISAYLGNVDSHNNAEVRALLAPLAELAAKHEIAIICVSHLNKCGNNEVLTRVTGSLAFVAAARAAFLVAPDPSDINNRLFLPMKNNIGNDKTGFSFKIESVELPNGITTSKIVWANEPVTTTVNEAMATGQNLEEVGALEDAEKFLLDLLEYGQVSAKKVKSESDQACHSWATIRRAQKKLGIEIRKSGFGSGWYWHLPPKVLKTPGDAHAKCVSTFDQFEHLRQNLSLPIGSQKNEIISELSHKTPEEEVIV